jgi:hypothetical protein
MDGPNVICNCSDCEGAYVSRRSYFRHNNTIPYCDAEKMDVGSDDETEMTSNNKKRLYSVIWVQY